MTTSLTTPAYLTLLSAIIVALGGAFGAYVRTSRKLDTHADEANVKLDAIHVLVNSRLDAAFGLVKSLTDQLVANGIMPADHPATVTGPDGKPIVAAPAQAAVLAAMAGAITPADPPPAGTSPTGTGT